MGVAYLSANRVSDPGAGTVYVTNSQGSKVSSGFV